MARSLTDIPILRGSVRRLFALSPFPFAMLIAIAAHALRLPVAAAIMHLSGAPPGALIRTDILDLLARGPLAAVVTAAAVLTLVPLGETLACQWIPMLLLRPAGSLVRVFGSAGLFAYLHTFSPGPPAVLFAAAFVPGVLFAITLLRWEGHGLRIALLTTTLAHALTNLVALAALAIVARGGL